MAVAIPNICNPATYPLAEAIRIAQSCATATPAFELHLVQYLQAQSLSQHVSLPVIFRGLEVLGGVLSGGTPDQNRLATLLRPFLRSSDPQIASKAVLILGRQTRNLSFLRGILSETDERIRANLIESLWDRNDPEVEAIFESALPDPHPRVAANAVYGLYLMGSDAWSAALDQLVANPEAAFRRSAIWVLKSAAGADAPARLQPLIRDRDHEVRRSAFAALKYLREKNSPTASAA